MLLLRLVFSGLLFGAVALFAADGGQGGQGGQGGAVTLPTKFWVFIGTYTNGKSKGIYRCELSLLTGKLTKPVLAAELRSPSFLAIHPNHRFLYAVNESGSGKNTGAVSALSLDPAKGTLKF